MPEGLSAKEKLEKVREYKAMEKAAKKAMKLASGQLLPEKNGRGRPKSIVNKVTEYGALFNQLNEQRMSSGLPGLVTAMETLIEAMQPENGLDIKDRARIAEKIATFESSRAPVISIEHVQNIQKEEEVDAEEAMKDFIESLRKV